MRFPRFAVPFSLGALSALLFPALVPAIIAPLLAVFFIALNVFLLIPVFDRGR